MLKYILESNIALGVGLAVGIVLTDPAWLDGSFPPLTLGLIVGLVAGYFHGLNWVTADMSKLVWSFLAFLVTMRKFLKTDGVCGMADIGGVTGAPLVAAVSGVAALFCIAAFWRHGTIGASGAALVALLLAKFLSFLAFPNGLEVDVGVSLTAATLGIIALVAGFALRSHSALTFAQYVLSGGLAAATLLIYLALVEVPICGEAPERILLVAMAFMVGWARPGFKVHGSRAFAAIGRTVGPPRSRS